MNAYDPRLHEQQQKLEALEARMAQYEKKAHMIVIVGIVMAALALGVLFNHDVGVQWSPSNLSGFIP